MNISSTHSPDQNPEAPDMTTQHLGKIRLAAVDAYALSFQRPLWTSSDHLSRYAKVICSPEKLNGSHT